MNTDIKKAIKLLESEGWTVERGGKHFKLRSPRGHLVVSSVTPSCPHAHKNLLRDCRKAMK